MGPVIGLAFALAIAAVGIIGLRRNLRGQRVFPSYEYDLFPKASWPRVEAIRHLTLIVAAVAFAVFCSIKIFQGE